MNLKRLREFMIDKTIFPGYHARVGMKFVQYKGVNFRGYRALGMEVVKTDETSIFLRDNNSDMEFRVPREEIRASTIVRMYHAT